METYFFVNIDDYVVPASGHDCESKRYCSRRETQREAERVAVCMKVLLVCAWVMLEVRLWTAKVKFWVDANTVG